MTEACCRKSIGEELQIRRSSPLGRRCPKPHHLLHATTANRKKGRSIVVPHGEEVLHPRLAEEGTPLRFSPSPPRHARRNIASQHTAMLLLLTTTTGQGKQVNQAPMHHREAHDPIFIQGHGGCHRYPQVQPEKLERGKKNPRA
jgi:hypothetical protein